MLKEWPSVAAYQKWYWFVHYRHPKKREGDAALAARTCGLEQASQLQDESTPAPDEQAMLTEQRAAIDRALATLAYREREIITLRYGLGDGYTYTLEEVGLIFNIAPERVRQIEAKGIRKLQHPVRSCIFGGVIDLEA